MTTPSILPVEYDGTSRDYLKVKDDRSGASRQYRGAVTVPSGTVATTIVGLVPFNKGAAFKINSSSIYVADIGAGTTTISIGYVYDDNTNNTNNQTAWASASTAIQAGGFITMTAGTAGISFVATANGWVCATINTATTDASGAITFQIDGVYDGLGADNSNNQN